ncbi:hypothetical protein M0R45_018607 [Rubus argutus]|uniref:Acetylglutamate kinase n=1 Tax=Rubus argutus TaxID=59490 RepID=A0AAW1X4M0_RUBAR
MSMSSDAMSRAICIQSIDNSGDCVCGVGHVRAAVQHHCGHRGRRDISSVGGRDLILLTDVAGILDDRDDPSNLVKEIDIKGVRKMMEDGKIGGGMIPKVLIDEGVRTTIIG